MTERPTMTASVRTVVVLSACFAPLALLAATLEASKAHVVEVTVYPDRKDIPVAAEPDSLRVTAKGVQAVLGAVAIRERADTPKDTHEQIALRDEVKRLEGEIAKIGSQDRVAVELREFLKSLRATTAQRESENIGAGRADPAAVTAVYDLLFVSLEGSPRPSGDPIVDPGASQEVVFRQKRVLVPTDLLADRKNIENVRFRPRIDSRSSP